MKKVLLILLLSSILISGISSQEESKPIVAILDLFGDGGSKAETKAITNLLISSIYETDLVSVIDRNQREEILSEIMFSLSGCADESCAIEVGKMLAADIMIIGTLDSIGSRLSVDLKAIDVASSKLVGTFNKLFESIDEIVDSIDLIGGQLVQNFTGKMATKKAVLEYEELVPLFVSCNIEGADVFVDGVAVGKIIDGTLTKALNKNAEVVLEILEDGYYPYKEKIVMDVEKSVEANLDVLELKRFAFKTQMGGGIMGSFYGTVFIVPNWWYVDMGLGFTISSLDPSLINIPIAIRGGRYILFDDRSKFRFFAGGVIIYDLATLFEYTNFYFKSLDMFRYGFNYGMYGGAEYKLTNKLRVTSDINLFLNELVQNWMHLIQFSIGLTVIK